MGIESFENSLAFAQVRNGCSQCIQGVQDHPGRGESQAASYLTYLHIHRCERNVT